MAIAVIGKKCSILEEDYYKGFEDGATTNNN